MKVRVRGSSEGEGWRMCEGRVRGLGFEFRVRVTRALFGERVHNLFGIIV